MTPYKVIPLKSDGGTREMLKFVMSTPFGPVLATPLVIYMYVSGEGTSIMWSQFCSTENKHDYCMCSSMTAEWLTV